jgi:hypothetical protein
MMATLISSLIIPVFIVKYVYTSQQDSDPALMISLLSEVSEHFNYSNCNVVIVNDPNSVSEKNNYRFNNTEYDNFHLSDNPIALFAPKFNDSFSKGRQTEYRFASRFSCACSLVIYDENASHAILSNADVLGWIRFYIPGRIFGSFHLLRDGTNHQITREWNGTTILRYAAILTSSSNHTKPPKKLFTATTKSNWNKAPIIYRIHPGAGDATLQYFKTHGEWDNFAIANIYYTAEYLNASLIFETVYSPPVRGILPSGRYDDYVQPLIDGTAHTSSFNEPSSFAPGVVFFSKSVLHDQTSFLTAPPKLQMVSFLQAIFLPFSFETWLALLINIVAIFALLLAAEWTFSSSEMVDPFHKLRNTRGNMLELFLTASKSVLEQPSLEEDIHPVLRKLYFWRPLLSWSLLSTVLCGLYKSELIGAFVSPTFVSPPRNFDELSRSEYKIKSILFAGNIDLALKIVNDSLAQMLLSRVEEVAWPDGMQEVC